MVSSYVNRGFMYMYIWLIKYIYIYTVCNLYKCSVYSYSFNYQPEDGQWKGPKHVVDLYVINYTYLYHHIVVLDKYTHSNLVYYKQNGDDKPYDPRFIPSNDLLQEILTMIIKAEEVSEGYTHVVFLVVLSQLWRDPPAAHFSVP